MIGGDTFGISNNHGSCFNPDHARSCHSIDAPNLVDQLEAAHIAWEGLFESMPAAGFLGEKFPEHEPLYAQKHNPFVYFKSVALDPARLAKLKPFVSSELKAELADLTSASRFIYIVPNLCDDEHGATGCKQVAVMLAAGDAFLSATIPEIINTPAFTDRSVLFITFDNSNGIGACCGDWIGGGRIPLIAVTKHAMKVRGETPSNHYSLLATIEDGFGLPRLANATGAATLFDLLPDFAQEAR
jgi:phosphatidylinositol-3-phosphatase